MLSVTARIFQQASTEVPLHPASAILVLLEISAAAQILARQEIVDQETVADRTVIWAQLASATGRWAEASAGFVASTGFVICLHRCPPSATAHPLKTVPASFSFVAEQQDPTSLDQAALWELNPAPAA